MIASIISQIWKKQFPFLVVQNRWLLASRGIKYIWFLTLADAEIASLTYMIVLIAWINSGIVDKNCLPANLLIASINFFITLEVILLTYHVSHERWIRGLDNVVIIHETYIAMIALYVSSTHDYAWHRVHKSRCYASNITRTADLAYAQRSTGVYILII